jgi:DNA adenine methylase
LQLQDSIEIQNNVALPNIDVASFKWVKSPLRYPGGKSKALKQILPYVPIGFREYREPFLGGGSVFIALKQLYPNATYKINDANFDLYCFWVNLKRRKYDFIDEVLEIKRRYQDGKSLFKKFSVIPTGSDDFYRGVRFYILNRITYSGAVDRGGFSAEAFEKRFTLSNISRLKPLSELLQTVEITNDSYEDLLLRNGKNVFTFMDPPYLKAMKNGLYGSKGSLHKNFNHQNFALDVKKCEHHWLITLDDSQEIRNLFNFANDTKSWQLYYGMTNAGNNVPCKGKELLLSNYPLVNNKNEAQKG